MQVHKELMQYENCSPKSCWKEAWKSWENRKIFTKEEGQLFLECGRLLEQGSGGMFEKEAELLIERINILIQREQTEMRERIKVSRNISGADSGLMEEKMSVNLIFKIAAVGILVTVISQVLKHSGREEHAFLTSLAGLLIVLFWIVPYIYDLFETMKSLFSL